MKIYAGRTEIPRVNKHIPTYEEMAAKGKQQEQKPKVQQLITGAQREETVQDRLAELNHAYDLHTTFLAASKKVMAQIKGAFGKEKLSEKPEDIEQKTKEACMEAVSEKNLERLRHKVNSFHQYSLNLSIGTHWRQVLGKVW